MMDPQTKKQVLADRRHCSTRSLPESEYFDSPDAAQVTVKDLVDVMGHFLKDTKCEAYSHPYTKTKLMNIIVMGLFKSSACTFTGGYGTQCYVACRSFPGSSILYALQEDEAKEQEEEIVSADASLTDMFDMSSGNQELGEMLHKNLVDAALNAIQKLLEDLFAGRRSSADVACDKVLTVISKKLKQQKEALAHKRTSALCLQYMKMTDILKSSIKG